MHQVLGIIGWFSNMHVINYGAYAAFKRFYRIRQACVCVCVLSIVAGFATCNELLEVFDHIVE